MKDLPENKLTANVIRACVKTVRKFFRFNKIVVTVEDFNELVPLPRKEQPPKTGIDKTNVVRYLNACKNIQLKTALHVMASNGPRPIEVCAVRECDVNLDSDPATITYAAEYSKMRVARDKTTYQRSCQPTAIMGYIQVQNSMDNCKRRRRKW